MRDFLDAILTVIGSESLTDDEYQVIADLEMPVGYSKDVYLALRSMLEARENVSDQVKKLKLYFIVRGTDIAATPKIPSPRSNIFIGGSLSGPFNPPSSSEEIISGPAGEDGEDFSPTIKAGVIEADDFTGSPRKSTVTFITPFPDDNYVVNVTAVDSRSWTYENKTAAGFTVNSNASTALTGEVSWTATRAGEN